MKHQTVEGRKYIEWGDVQKSYAYELKTSILQEKGL